MFLNFPAVLVFLQISSLYSLRPLPHEKAILMNVSVQVSLCKREGRKKRKRGETISRKLPREIFICPLPFSSPALPCLLFSVPFLRKSRETFLPDWAGLLTADDDSYPPFLLFGPLFPISHFLLLSSLLPSPVAAICIEIEWMRRRRRREGQGQPSDEARLIAALLVPFLFVEMFEFSSFLSSDGEDTHTKKKPKPSTPPPYLFPA